MTGINSQNKGTARRVKNNTKTQTEAKTNKQFVKISAQVVMTLREFAISRRIVLPKANETINVKVLTKKTAM
jgi:hypothetical protein